MKITKFLRLLLVLTVLSLGVLAFTACEGGTKLTAPTNIKYDGTTITWNVVEGATGYTVKINDGNEYTVNSPSFAYDASNANFSVVIKATSNKKSVAASDATTINFLPLEKISEVRFDEFGVASWDVVDTATAYAIRIDGKEVKTVTETTYSEIPAGAHSFQVRPVVEGNPSYYSSWSNSRNINILGTVAKDDITYNNGVISWKYVSGAQGYEVRVNGNVIAEKNTGTSVLYDAQNVGFEVNIRAIGNGTTTYTGAMSEAKAFIFLDTVTNIVVEDGILKWEAIGGADGYKIKLNGVESSEKLTKNEYAKLTANVSTDIQIRPYSNDTSYFSDWSQVKSVFILPAPVLQWNQDYALDGEPNNNAYWDGVSGANGYTVRLTKPDGTVITSEYGTTERSFNEAYLAVGIYKVEVKSNAPTDSTTVYGSVYSAPITVIRLASPKAETQDRFIVSDAASLAKGFTVTFKKVEGASQYELIRDNASFKLTTTNQFIVGDVVANNVTAEQNFNFAIKAKGSVQKMNGQIVATLDSLTQEALTFQIKVLPTPTNAVMSGFKFTYDTIVGAEGYVIDVGGSSFTSNNGEYDLSMLEAGSFDVKVCAKGNGTNILASNYTAAVKVQRLAPPTNIKIGVTDGAEGVLSFDKIMYATGYYIVFNDDGNAIPVGEMMNINDYITEIPGTDIHMIASANYYNNDNTVYYMTSKSSTTFRCIKLSAPGFGDKAFSDAQFFWNAPANTNTSIYTPTYIVYNANGVAYNGEKNGTSMNISYLEGGKDYTFQVKAVGNGVNYINSVLSEIVTIHKLATPVVTRENGKYVWNAVPRATGYVVYIDGVIKAEFTHEAGKKYEFTPDFDEIGKYKVEVQAIGDEGYTTINSDRCTIVQETKQLTTPDFSVSYSEASYSKTGKIVVTITDEPLYAKGYSYTIGGATHTSTETTYSIVPNSVGNFTVRVFALGGNFDEEGFYYIASQSESKSITLLGAPNPDDFIPSEDGILSWTGVNGANGYVLILTINGVEQKPIEVSGTSYTLPNYSEIKTLKVEIAAKGYGNKIITSAFSEREWGNLH